MFSLKVGNCLHKKNPSIKNLLLLRKSGQKNGHSQILRKNSLENLVPSKDENLKQIKTRL